MENHKTPMSPQAPETPCSCSFSKHGQCIHTLVAQVPPCLAPDGCEMWFQALSPGEQCREAAQPKDSILPSLHRATMCCFWLWSLFSPADRDLLTRDALAYLFALVSNPLHPAHVDALTLLCTQPAASLHVAGVVLFPQPLFSVSQVSLSLLPSLSSFLWLGEDS